MELLNVIRELRLLWKAETLAFQPAARSNRGADRYPGAANRSAVFCPALAFKNSQSRLVEHPERQVLCALARRFLRQNSGRLFRNPYEARRNFFVEPDISDRNVPEQDDV